MDKEKPNDRKNIIKGEDNFKVDETELKEEPIDWPTPIREPKIFNIIDKMRIKEKWANFEISNEETYECGICWSSFSSESPFKTHIPSHEDQLKLKFHTKIDTGEKFCECRVHEKAFAEMGSLRKQMRSHTGDEPFHCEFCQKKFASSKNIKIHMRIHTGEKPYECNVCQKKFARGDHLKRHMRTHTGEKPYECEICKRKFAERATVKKHMRTHTNAISEN